MNVEQIANSISYCGLICHLCRPDGGCNCRTGNHCGKRLSPNGCYQYRCCIEKGIIGCWECTDAPCGIDMLAKNKIKLRAFITYLKEEGIDAFSQSILHNTEKGIIYHRNGIYGDYDLETEQNVLDLLRNGDRIKE